MNVANIKYHIDGQNASPRIGWYAGGFSEINLNVKLFIRPELTYSSKGYKFTLLSNDKETAQFNYVTLPVFLGFRATNHLHVFVGPEFGYLLSAKVNGNYPGDLTERFERFDKGVDLGLAYQFSKALGAELRYNYGFKSIQEGYYSDQNGNRTTYNIASNRVLQVGLYYRFTQ